MPFIESFSLFEQRNGSPSYEPNEKRKQLKRRELQNIQRFRAAQEREDNYGIKYYQLRMKIDKIDQEKNKYRKEIYKLKKKFKK